MQRLIPVSLSLLMVAVPVHADDDQRAARRALEAGEIRPVHALLDKVESECAGDLIEVELERDDGRWIYEVKLLGPRGDVDELDYDAGTFDLLEAEGRQLDELGCVPPGTPED